MEISHLIFPSDLIGEFSYPLKRVLTEEAMTFRAFQVHPMKKEYQSEAYDLRKSKVTLKFTLGRKDLGKKGSSKKMDLAGRARLEIQKRGASATDNFTDVPMHRAMSRDE